MNGTCKQVCRSSVSAVGGVAGVRNLFLSPRSSAAYDAPVPSPFSAHYVLVLLLRCPCVPHAADANILINTCRLTAQRYYFAYQEPMPVEQLVRALCDTKQVRLL
jgi:hypothetical protein